MKPSVTVVIPTFNRAAALILSLEHLERQTRRDFEVVVVDDGSTDQTPDRVRAYLRNTSLKLRFLKQQNSGPARARNIAIAEAESPLILMIGDDIFASPRLVETHLNLHLNRPERHVAGLGLTVWDDSLQKITPFMRFLEEGAQFAYPDLLAGRKPEGGQYFYTSNLSAKTELLRSNPFCERFPGAAFEDLELGYRLVQRERLELVFLPDGLARHYHPTTFLQACRRMRKSGWAAHLLREIWPDSLLHPAGKTAFRRAVRKALAPAPTLFVATYATAALSRICSPKVLLRAVLGTHFYLGYRDRATEQQHA